MTFIEPDCITVKSKDATPSPKKIGIDLWRYLTLDRPQIRRALDWLIPFALGEKQWPYQQISALEPRRIAPLLRRAATVYREPEYERAIGKLRGVSGEESWLLFYPKRVTPK